MFDYDDEFDDSDESRDNSAIKQVRAAQRAAEKRVKELEAELSTFRSNARLSNVKDSIAARGLNPKIAALIPPDVEGDAVASWLDQYGDLFGGPAPESADAPSDEQTPPADAQVFSQVASTGTPPSSDEAQLLALIKGASTPAELNQILFGNPSGQVLR